MVDEVVWYCVKNMMILVTVVLVSGVLLWEMVIGLYYLLHLFLQAITGRTDI